MSGIFAFQKEYLKSEQKIVIYGAGRYGELALRGLEAMGLEPACFIDRNNEVDEFLGYKVESPECINKYSDALFLVASLNYFGEIVDLLSEKKICSIYEISSLIELEYDESVLSEYALDEKKCKDKYANVVKYYDPEKLMLNHVEVVITEKCSLKCKDCANLIQYYSGTQNYSANDVIEAIEALLKNVSAILDVRILGGEPFMNLELDTIIERLQKNDKIKRISIYTNSTIVPNERIINSLKNKKVFVHMSNYGRYSKQLNSLKSVLQKNGIEYYVHNYEKWYDLGKPVIHEYTQSFANELFNNCVMAKCYTLLGTKLFLCPRAAHGEALGMFFNREDEFFDVSEDNIGHLKRVINRNQALTACYYCNGSCNRGNNLIESAVQVENGNL